MPVRTARAFEKGRGTDGRMGNFADGMTGISNGESYIPSINQSSHSIKPIHEPRYPRSNLELIPWWWRGGGREREREEEGGGGEGGKEGAIIHN